MKESILNSKGVSIKPKYEIERSIKVTYSVLEKEGSEQGEETEQAVDHGGASTVIVDNSINGNALTGLGLVVSRSASETGSLVGGIARETTVSVSVVAARGAGVVNENRAGSTLGASGGTEDLTVDAVGVVESRCCGHGEFHPCH